MHSSVIVITPGNFVLTLYFYVFNGRRSCQARKEMEMKLHIVVLVSKDTISRWIRTVMMNAGLDVTTSKPHSTRSAATSKATQACVPIQDILKQAGWSNHRTFDRFYNKPVRKESSFAESVLKVD